MPVPIKVLLERMYRAIGYPNIKERKQLTGKEPRRWFVDNMDCGSYDELLDLFDSQIHDDNWHALWQDKWSRTRDRNVEARSVSFMDSGRRGVVRHYLEDEVSPIPRTRHFNGNWLAQKPELDMLFTRFG